MSCGCFQPQPDPNQWNGSYYGYGQGYEAYGYAQPPQDPNMYAYGAYPGYGNYQQQQVTMLLAAYFPDLFWMTIF